jgi:hypothetical protein
MIGDTFTSPLPNRTAMLVAAFDSQLKWAGAIRRELESKGFACRVIVPSDIRHSISPGQLADSGGGAVTYLPWTELVAASLQVDVVVLAIQGPHVRRFCHDLRCRATRGIARWILPYGIQLQLRQARARRKAVREQGAVRAQRAGSELDPARRA